MKSNKRINKLRHSTSVDILADLCTHYLSSNGHGDSIYIADSTRLSGFSHSGKNVVLFGLYLQRVLESGIWEGDAFKIWVLSSSVKKSLIENFNFKESEVAILPLDFYFPNSTTRTATLNIDNSNFVYSGRIVPGKNIELFLSTCSILQNHYKCNITPKIYGGYDKFSSIVDGKLTNYQYFKSIESLIEQLEWTRRPEFIFDLEPNEWVDKMKPNDILINFSTHIYEDFGVSCHQFLNLGLPMILSHWGGHIDISGENIFKIPASLLNTEYCKNPNIKMRSEKLAEIIYTKNFLNASTKDYQNDHTPPTAIDRTRLNSIRESVVKNFGSGALLEFLRGNPHHYFRNKHGQHFYLRHFFSFVDSSNADEVQIYSNDIEDVFWSRNFNKNSICICADYLSAKSDIFWLLTNFKNVTYFYKVLDKKVTLAKTLGVKIVEI